MSLVIQLKELQKSYFMAGQAIPVLKGINLDINKNEYVALMGPSGSGKSTLMNILGCLDSPTSGMYNLNGHDVSKMVDDDLAGIRKDLCFNNLIYYQDCLLQKTLHCHWYTLVFLKKTELNGPWWL
jgi:ABC-type lipoprotein export system ATPase subunit